MNYNNIYFADVPNSLLFIFETAPKCCVLGVHYTGGVLTAVWYFYQFNDQTKQNTGGVDDLHPQQELDLILL